jgi:hypothetical protein
MSRKLRLSLLVLACVGFTAGAAVAQSSSDTSVKPRTGRTHTRFVVSFVPPASTSEGTTTTSQIHYVVSASMRSHPRGCNSAVSSTVDQAVAGSMSHVQLSPNNGHGHWCGGLFRGQIAEYVTTSCGCPGPVHAAIVCPLGARSASGKPRLCPLKQARSTGPDIMVAPRTVGTFSFRVRKRR